MIGSNTVNFRRLARSHFPLPRIRFHTLDSLTIRNFRLVWIAVLCLGGSDWMVNVVIGWMTYETTQSPLITSMALGLGGLPFLLLGPIAGVAADSWDRRKLMLVMIAGQATLTAIFALTVMSGNLKTWHIFAIVLLFGVAAAFLHSSLLPTIPNIVPKRYLINAFALNSLAHNITRLIIPAVAGASIALVGPGINLLSAVALYCGAVISIYALRTPDKLDSQPRTTPPLKRFLEGIEYIRGEPVVIALLIMGMMPMILLMPIINGLMPVFASDVFNAGPTGLGVLISSLGLGSTFGAIIIASFSNIRKKGLLLYGSLGVGIAFTIAFALSSVMIVSASLLIVISGSITIFFSVSLALIQNTVPDKLRGRVAAVTGMTIGLFSIGALITGTVAEILGAPAATIISAGLLTFLLFIFAAVFPKVFRFN